MALRRITTSNTLLLDVDATESAHSPRGDVMMHMPRLLQSSFIRPMVSSFSGSNITILTRFPVLFSTASDITLSGSANPARDGSSTRTNLYLALDGHWTSQVAVHQFECFLCARTTSFEQEVLRLRHSASCTVVESRHVLW
jgi:hypothetical protein